MQYYTVSANANGEFPAARGSAPATPVSGVVFDVDPQGRRRAVFGASNGALDRAEQNQVRLRGGYELTDWLEVEGFAAHWRNDSVTENRTLMRDAGGGGVWSGRVLAGDIVFDVPASALAPSERAERHAQWGATLRTRRSDGWNGSLVYSQYAVHEDLTRQALSPDPSAKQGGAGTLTERDGTGWRTLEAQAVRDIAGHSLAFGFHRNDYQLRNPVYEAADWRGPRGGLAQDVYGDTRLIAWYAQDAWTIADHWSLTLGARYEDWRAYDGGQLAGAARVDYAERSLSALSPKASIAFDPGGAWTARLSVGRGVRFPTVAELFQGAATASSITVNDPDLEAEVADAADFTVERAFAAGRVRASVFQDDVRDSIFAQTNIAVTPNVTNVQNIERVRSRGVELELAAAPASIPAWTFSGNLAYVRTRILENANNATYVGNEWPRVPHWRGALQATWRPATAWLASFAARYSGRMYNRLENDDVNPDVYGGVSRLTMVDARLAYTAQQGVELAFGVDNLTDERAYQSHPYPGRTAYLEARWSLGGEP
jgi:iron complex outermembrane recepter protein